MKLRLLDLFSGIGGFSLGLERSGNFETIAFCEIEPYPRAVLKKHWPNVKVYEDVKELSRERLEADGLGVDAICGGFPCQDISTAGRGAGLAGERSGLWFEFHRLIKEIKPQVAIIENVSALRSRGLDQVLRSLAEIGYDAEWHCIPASAVGAPHRRDRIWIVAYPASQRYGKWREERNICETDGGSHGQMRPEFVFASSRTENLANATELHSNGRNTDSEVGITSTCESGNSSGADNLADTICLGQQGSWTSGYASDQETAGERQAIDALNGGLRDFWRVEPDVGRVANGVPNRVDRLRALGNAVVPQIPEMIGRAIK
jgi:DNA (cytosine-5)-methyltransferase 1